MWDKLVEKYTGLPSNTTFVQSYVVPATLNDKFWNEKCAFCWGTYSTEHPPVKVLPCGHVFGHACVVDMVNTRDSDELCPYRRVQLFRRDFTLGLMLATFFRLILWAIDEYKFYVFYACYLFHLRVNSLMVRDHVLAVPLGLALGGPQFIAICFVKNFTGIYIRNPQLDLGVVFMTSSLITPLSFALGNAPFIWPLYFMFGVRGLCIVVFVWDCYSTIFLYHIMWSIRQKSPTYDNDRAAIKRLDAIAIAVKEVMVLGAVLYPAFGSALQLVWSSIACIAWR